MIRPSCHSLSVPCVDGSQGPSPYKLAEKSIPHRSLKDGVFSFGMAKGKERARFGLITLCRVWFGWFLFFPIHMKALGSPSRLERSECSSI